MCIVDRTACTVDNVQRNDHTVKPIGSAVPHGWGSQNKPYFTNIYETKKKMFALSCYWHTES